MKLRGNPAHFYHEQPLWQCVLSGKLAVIAFNEQAASQDNEASTYIRDHKYRAAERAESLRFRPKEIGSWHIRQSIDFS